MTADITLLRPSWVRKIEVSHAQDLVPGDCWLWRGSGSGGQGKAFYGRVRRDGRGLYLHRVAYELLVGSIPDGLQLDHLCRQTACCNPEHLEPVTCLTNARRGEKATKTRCLRGHPLSGPNLYLSAHPKGYRRVCRECRDAYMAEWRAAREERERQTWSKYLHTEAVPA